MVKSSATSHSKLASSARSKGVDNRSPFNSAAIGMSWQLAVVVLLPIFGGYKLDTVFGPSPVWTLVGLVLAMVLSILVIRRALKEVNNFSIPAAEDTDQNDEGGKR